MDSDDERVERVEELARWRSGQVEVAHLLAALDSARRHGCALPPAVERAATRVRDWINETPETFMARWLAGLEADCAAAAEE